MRTVHNWQPSGLSSLIGQATVRPMTCDSSLVLSALSCLVSSVN